MFLTVPKREGHACHRGNIEKYPGWLEGRESQGERWVRAFIVASMARKGKAGETGFGLASLSNFSRL